MVGPLSDLALACLYRGGSPAAASPGDAALGAALRRLFEEGERGFPGLGLSVDVFVTHLAARAPDGLPTPERGPDLYLACACAAGVRGALEAFERAHLAPMGAHLARLGPSPAFVDEVRQEVRTRLFVSKDGAPPRIAGYDGRGALASWVRVIAVREALDLRRQGGAAAPAQEPKREAAAEGDPEGDYQQEHYRRAFDEALRGAVAALDDAQRRLLRRHLAEAITLEALAAELGVHRATVARHLAGARTALRRDTRRRLQAALGGTESELESVAAMMRSRLDLSLRGLLRTR